MPRPEPPIPQGLTRRQAELVLLLCDGDPREGSWDLPRLHERAGRGATRQALVCSLKILERKGLVRLEHRLRRDKTLLILEATDLARRWRRQRLGAP